MKKRILGLVLALVMLFSTVPTALADSTVDPVVQTIYDTLVSLETHLAGNDIEALKTAMLPLTDMDEDFELSDEQNAQLEELFSSLSEDELMDILTNLLIAAALIEIDDAITQYTTDSNVKTALEITYMYESVFGDPEFSDAETQATIRRFFPDIDDIYDAALDDAPKGNVKAFFEICTEIEDAVFGFSDRDLSDVLADAEEILAASENYTTEEKADIELLMEEDLATSISGLKSYLATGKEILKVGEIYDAYVATPNKTTAKALVDKYDEIFDGDDEALQEGVWSHYFDIDEVYDEASELLETGKKPNKKPNNDKKPIKDSEKAPVKSPLTGEESSATSVLLFLSAAAFVSLLVYGKKQKLMNK